MKSLSLFIWVQHLFGKGHVQRMARIAAVCADQGMNVTVVAGGPGGRKAFSKLANVSAHQLPALRTKDRQYTGLLTDRNAPPDEAYWAMRAQAINEVLTFTQPDIVLTELFPFGRRKFSGEVLGLIKTARELGSKPLIASSVRDIIEPKKEPEKTAQMAGWLKDHFDAVLVHGDPAIMSLEETAPFAADTGVPCHYTGYVTPEADPIRYEGPKAGVVVSAGSGLSGAGLLANAAQAGNSAATAQNPWHIFVPPGVDAPSSGTNPHLFVHPFGVTFADHLAAAEVSVAEAGYNTTAEALALGTRQVLVPYGAGQGEADQTEQPRRAHRMAAKGLAICLEPGTLNPLRLIKDVEAAKALKEPKIAVPGLNLSGTLNTFGILKGLREGGQAF